MESNRWHSADSDARYRAENHRVGQALYRRDQQQHTRNPQEQYQHGQNYHNRNQGYSPDQSHYGSRPDSVYRNPDINFGDNPNRQHQDYRQNRDQYGRQSGTSSRNPYAEDYGRQSGTSSQSPYAEDITRPEQHHDDQIWSERNRYKDEDFRYRSGHRDTWRLYNDNDETAERQESPPRGDYRGREQGFFDRVGNSISHAWRNMTRDEEQDRNDRHQNRQFNRGYESGPRWADESQNERAYQRRSYRNDDDRY